MSFRGLSRLCEAGVYAILPQAYHARLGALVRLWEGLVEYGLNVGETILPRYPSRLMYLNSLIRNYLRVELQATRQKIGAIGDFGGGGVYKSLDEMRCRIRDPDRGSCHGRFLLYSRCARSDRSTTT